MHARDSDAVDFVYFHPRAFQCTITKVLCPSQKFRQRKVSVRNSVGKNAVWACRILSPQRSLTNMQEGTAMLLISSLFHPDGWKRLEIKSIAVPWMHTLQFGREKCSLTTSAGKNCIFPYRDTWLVKLWLWIPNSNDALLGCPGITIIYYQSFVSMAKASPAKSVVRNSAGKNAVWAYRILLPHRSLNINAARDCNALDLQSFPPFRVEKSGDQEHCSPLHAYSSIR